MHAVAEAARNVATSGARPIAATNCLNFGSPEKTEVMWQFSQAIDGISEACIALGTPITGGNVSFYNETLGKSIYPTPVIGILGILEDSSRVMKIAFREAGDRIVLLDGASITGDSASAALNSQSALLPSQAQEFSSSEYSKTLGGIVAGEPPAIDLQAEKRLIDCLIALADHHSIASAHDISDGGLAVTLAESCFASVGARHAVPALGASIVAPGSSATSAEFALFGEHGARCVISVSSARLAALQATARQYGVVATDIGQVTAQPSLRIEYKGCAIIDSPIESLRDAWANSLERTLTAK
jgi:phosphoribosylformylglycinamidine synthase